jgi:potassium-dependent mechanosensitive channel
MSRNRQMCSQTLKPGRRRNAVFPCRRTFWACGVFGALLLAGLIGPQARAQVSSPASQADASVVAELKQRLTETNALISEEEASDKASPVSGVTERDRLTRRILLQELRRTYEGHFAMLAQIEIANSELEQRLQRIKSWGSFSSGPPYSLLLIDSLREAVNAQDLKLKETQATKRYLQAAAESTRNALKDHEKNIRRLTESLESTSNPSARERTIAALELEKLKSRVASAALASIEAQGRLAELEAIGATQYRDFVRSQITLAGNQIIFPQADLDRVIAQIEQEVAQEEARFSALNSLLPGKQSEIQQAKTQLDAAALNSAEASSMPVLFEAYSLRSDQLDTLNGHLAAQKLIIDGLRQAENIYRFRFVLANSTDLPGVRDASLRMDETIERLRRVRGYLNFLNDLNRGLFTEQQSRLRTLSPDSPLWTLVEERIATLRERLEITNRIVDQVEQSDRFVSRWAEMIEDSQRNLSPVERLQLAFRNAQNLFDRLWNFELYNAVDTIVVDGQKVTGRRSVTVGKVVQIILILVLGFFLCRLLAALVKRIARARFKFQENASQVLGRWVFGVLLTILVFLSLILVKIPFEAFAFLGGALAIGVGFGTQNLLKNLISGMIILIERPMRLGDIVEIASTRGQVTNIGVRSSIIRRSDGVEILIPNSTFLETSVTNLTYSSKNLQSTLSLSVAYGASVRKVSHLLVQIVGSHGMVLKKPPPATTLTEFAEKGMLFTVTYWLDITTADPVTVASDLRQMVANQLSASGMSLSNIPAESVKSDAGPEPAAINDPGTGLRDRSLR